MIEPLVSVNITTYNRSELLARCLDSVLAQNYKNLEIIIVDDHSIDATERIVSAYMKRDKRIKYFRHKRNRGNAHARNTALKACTGKYVAFLDDDDEWIDPGKIKNQVMIFETTKNKHLGIICSAVNIIRDNNIQPRYFQMPANLVRHMLKRNSLIHNSTVLTKREIIAEVGGFDVKLKREIDSDFFRNCIVKYGYEIHIMPEITINYSEKGADRITLLRNISPLLKHIYSDIRNIQKYFIFFLCNPSALIYRMASITKALIEILVIIITKTLKLG